MASIFDKGWTIAQVQQWAAQELALNDTAVLDAEILLARVLKCSRAYLIAHREDFLNNEQILQYQTYIQRRKHYEPIAYIVGYKEFWSLELQVTRDTLIPRPETELLVEQALQKIMGQHCLIADLGTGSGAIALAIARERPLWRIIATDQSLVALQIATQNAESLNLKNVMFIKSYWCDGLPLDKFDAIVSNPPYISEAEWQNCEKDLTFEPLSALVSAENGLHDIQQIIKKAPLYLRKGGLLLLEHGHMQAQKIQSNLAERGYTQINSYADLAGKERVTSAVWLSD